MVPIFFFFLYFFFLFIKVHTVKCTSLNCKIPFIFIFYMCTSCNYHAQQDTEDVQNFRNVLHFPYPRRKLSFYLLSPLVCFAYSWPPHTWNHTMYRILFKAIKSSPNMSFLYFLGLFRDGLHRGCPGHGHGLVLPRKICYGQRWEVGHSDSNKYKKLQLQVKNSLLHSVIPEAFRWESPPCQPLA